MTRTTVERGERRRVLADRYVEVRRTTERLCRPLAPEDCVVQSMPDVSPTKWHLAHVSWFFETFLLVPHLTGYRRCHPEFEFLFNSYYNSVGRQFDRPRRGLLSRPTLAQVLAYRAQVDENVQRLLERAGGDPALEDLVELGLHHEQQHQELILMDILHVLSCNPLHPAYDERLAPTTGGAAAGAVEWIAHPGGTVTIGHAGDEFHFDNEGPRHEVRLARFRIASRPVTNAEYREFVEDGGYERHGLWLADGWARVHEAGWAAPLYWTRRDGQWYEFTLGGPGPLDAAAPVAHVSFYEAAAFAEWAGARLPTEFEWEALAAKAPIEGNLLEQGALRPLATPDGPPPRQLFGDVWEWTRSAYAPYPGYRPAPGAVGEYNGKWMCNQLVLRGGSCATPASHVRPTYRNFFYPHCRWPFAGIRLAQDD